MLAGVGNGSYQVYDEAGNFQETISDGSTSFTTGCAFNPSLDRLYATRYSPGNVVVYEAASPHAVAQVVAIQTGSAESVVFNDAGGFFVSGPNLGPRIEEYDSSGTLVDVDSPAVFESGGPNWIDLASDQRTVFLTSESQVISRYDVVADTDLPVFAQLPGAGGPAEAHALKLLPPGDGSGGLLVADTLDVKRLDGEGNVVTIYDAPGVDSWYGLALDADGVSFWAANFGSDTILRFNLLTGAVETGPVNTGSSDLFGLCVRGEPVAALSDITLTSPPVLSQPGFPATVTARVAPGGFAESDVPVRFAVVAGPHAGEVSDPGECQPSASCMTGSDGSVSWSYTGTMLGIDTVEACFTEVIGTDRCAHAQVQWRTEPGPDLSIQVTDSPDPLPSGEMLTYSLHVANHGAGDARNVTVNDVLPAAATFGSVTSTLGSCDKLDLVVRCAVGDLAEGAAADITIVVAVAELGTVTNEAQVENSLEDPNHSNNSDVETTQVVPFPVDIDILPRRDPNVIDLRQMRTVPVALLADPTLFIDDVDTSTLCFGDVEDRTQRDCSLARPARQRDVDSDGDLDLLLYFDIAETGIDVGDTIACLTAARLSGGFLEGCDPIQTR